MQVNIFVLTIQVPDVVHSRLEIDRPIKKDPPWTISKEDVKSILDTDNCPSYDLAEAKDMAFMMFRQDTERSKDLLSDWTEFNKHLHKDETKPASIVGMMPLLNHKADEYATIYTTGERMRYISQVLGQEHPWQTIDQAIHMPSMEVKWTYDEEWKNLRYRMGGLHNLLVMMATIGNHVEGSELCEIWIQSGIITEGSLDKILRGKDFKGGMFLHKVTLQTCWRKRLALKAADVDSKTAPGGAVCIVALEDSAHFAMSSAG